MESSYRRRSNLGNRRLSSEKLPRIPKAYLDSYPPSPIILVISG
jgi:hypothetical protein